MSDWDGFLEGLARQVAGGLPDCQEDKMKQLTAQLRFWNRRRNELSVALKQAEESIQLTLEQIKELETA